MKTAKELAFKAYCDALIVADPKFKEDWAGDDYDAKIREAFENWWASYYHRQEHKDSFHVEISVFIEGKRYIQAE